MSAPPILPMNPNDQPTLRHSGGSQATPPTNVSTLISVPPAPGPSFGDYDHLQEIARGGMGIVYKAHQKSLDRIVALKMLLPGSVAKADELERFRREAEATARLNHPNIVTVYEVGEIDGQCFYSMDYIAGSSLAQQVSDSPLTPRAAARYVMIVARAIHHAHTHGILHRDLKPSNILVDAADQPHVTDFGLAKRLGVDAGQTQTGTVMGTPSYMAPEQAAGRVNELGPACDVYGLGAILYELLTGRPPFHAQTPLETLHDITDKAPAPPRMLNPRVERDLETVCLKCLEKDPKQRYPTAEALADDLNRHLNGEAVTAKSFNMLDRLASALERSQHDVEFRSWGNMLLVFGLIILVGHAATFFLIQAGQAQWIDWCVRGLQFSLLGLVFLKFRARTLLPTSVAERQLWSIWIGYLVAYVFMVLGIRSMVRLGVIVAGETSPERWDELILYPCTATLTGLALFVMGSNYWGRCYALGVLFLILAFLMPFRLEWAPLGFGVLWAITLTAMGVHLRKLSHGGPGAEPELALPSDVL